MGGGEREREKEAKKIKKQDVSSKGDKVAKSRRLKKETLSHFTVSAT
jgi:hypothetical protein